MNGVTVEIGGSLREARRRLGLELSEVETATLIRARYLEALEHEHFDDLPPGSYRIVFLREYAEFLGVDSRILADEYLQRAAPAPVEPRPRGELGAGAAAVLGGVTKVHVAVAVALAVFGVIVWRLGTGGSGTPSPAPPVTAAAAAATPRRAPRRPPRKAPVRHDAAVHRAAPPVLSLVAARGSCWILVRRGSSSGAVVYERTLQQGQHVRLGLRSPLWIRLGAPWNLDASLRGKTLGSVLPATTGDLIASASGLRHV